MSAASTTAAREQLGALREALRRLPSLSALARESALMLMRTSTEPMETAAPMALCTAVLMRARERAHSAMSVNALVQEIAEVLAEEEAPRSIAWDACRHQSVEFWRRQLATSVLVSDGADPEVVTPFILRGELVQFRRYYDAERRIAQRIVERSRAPQHTFRVITGGPGTGKTTAVAKLIVDRLQHNPQLRVMLAAPTGKAAARMTDSVRQKFAEQRDTLAGTSLVPETVTAQTLHRLLRYLPATDRFRVNADSRLDADLVVVDEASMIDVLIMDAMLAAIDVGTEFVLVGDHHQLASIEAGDVLAGIVRAHAAGAPLQVDPLTKQWRFKETSGIGTIAGALREGRIGDALALLQTGRFEDLQFIAQRDNPEALLRVIASQLRACAEATTPDELLQALAEVRVLCPEREGAFGVRRFNQLIEAWLERECDVTTRDTWYHRRPVMVTANDYGLQVFNGDIGVCWHGADGVLVHFEDGDGGTRPIVPERLPATETAWAMTVHKCQGSEFGHVLFVLPRDESEILNRSLFYTAVTRAKDRVIVAGPVETAQRALERVEIRTTGLGELLAQAFTAHA